MVITKNQPFSFYNGDNKNKNKKLPSGKLLNAAVAITMIASTVLAVWQIPTATTSSSLEEIRVSRPS